MLQKLFSKIDKIVSFDEVSAHCDIPCKIYDPISAQLAVLSVIRFIDQLNELEDTSSLENQAKYIRLINEKEKHVEEAKRHVRVIWGDYFKQPQFESFPNTHDLVHKIMLAGSACKQGIARENAENMLDLVNQFAESFWSTKGVETYMAKCPYPPAEMVVYPRLG